MSVRWSTGAGIAVGGVSGALVALLSVASPRESVPAKADAAPPRATPPPVASEPPPAPVAEEPLLVASAAATAEEFAAPAPPAAPAPNASPPLELPTTREALLKAELYCDKRQDFDECGRAAAALEAGSAGPADPEQAKRFRRIALTHLVAKCEAGSAHACFVMAGKYRAGTELAASPVRAEALEKRGLDLCRLGRSAPECPPS